MLAIMGCDNTETMPLYMHSALLIMRNKGVDAFNYRDFKRQINAENLNPMQKAMIKLRLDLLDTFLRPEAPDIQSYFYAGKLVLVDLTDPFLDGLTAAVLFDIVLGLFMQWQSVNGKIIVLGEAHKYLINSDAARLTQSISSIIRLQLHLATRIIIATEEPTVIPSHPPCSTLRLSSSATASPHRRGVHILHGTCLQVTTLRRHSGSKMSCFLRRDNAWCSPLRPS